MSIDKIDACKHGQPIESAASKRDPIPKQVTLKYFKLESYFTPWKLFPISPQPSTFKSDWRVIWIRGPIFIIKIE